MTRRRVISDNGVADAVPLRQVLQSRNYGVALTDRGSWALLFEIGKFFQWFPPTADEGDDTLADRIAEFKSDRSAERIARGR